MIPGKYVPSITNYQRRKTTVVRVGRVSMGGDHPVVVQSMANTPTMDTMNSVEQVVRITKAGAGLVRLTARDVKEAKNLGNIKKALLQKGYDIPLSADIHFQSGAAEEAVKHVEKVRINPGNYAGKKKFQTIDYSDNEYANELERIKEKFIPLLISCKKYKRALRVGVNHGSLSDRIMSKYGDTPEGMVESAMEFLRVCAEKDFFDVVISLKSSNTRVMVYSTRLLIAAMVAENMFFPLHLGVTEAGSDEEGRIKSAVGISSLMADGLGDTIRVSLTENPEKEIPVARKLLQHEENRANHEKLPEIPYFFNPYYYKKHGTREIAGIGGHNTPVVIADFNPIIQDRKEISWEMTQKDEEWQFDQVTPDYLCFPEIGAKINIPGNTGIIIPYKKWIERVNREDNVHPLLSTREFLDDKNPKSLVLNFLLIDIESLTHEIINKVQHDDRLVIAAQNKTRNPVGEYRYILWKLLENDCQSPVILKMNYFEDDLETFQVKSAADLGPLFIDGLGDGIWLNNSGNIPREKIFSTAFHILQATGERVTRTEYISCPSCGRTMIDIQKLLKEVKNKTSHLKGLKIAVMGCIVNGPGEMADANYGLMGAGSGKVNLYKGKIPVKKNIPEEKAADELLTIIIKNQ